MLQLIRTLRSRAAVAATGAALLGAALLAGCGGGSSSDTGTMRVSLTDAPACGFDHVYVTVQKVRVHSSASASPSDGGWSEITLSPAQRIDLLNLQNGTLLPLGQTPLAPGKYQQMRLVLADNDGSNPLAESVVPTGGSEVALTTPSGLQTGLKMNVDVTVAANQLADVVIDFDACKSIVSAGQSGKYLLKPVLSVTPVFLSGVKGTADAGDAVSLQHNGTVVKSTTADSNGNYLLLADAGTYTLVVTAPAHATDVVTGVPVVAQQVTSLSAITLGASTTGVQAGAVANNPVSTPIDATVSALQATGGTTIEVASMGVDSLTGAYSFTLPLAAPMVAPYAATLTFAADATAAAKYTMAATSGGVTKTSALLTLTTGANAAVNFTFP